MYAALRLNQEKRKAKRMEAELHDCQQRLLDQGCTAGQEGQELGYPGTAPKAAGQGSLHSLAAAAPLTLRLLRCYDIVSMDYNTAAQDDALSRFSMQLDSVARALADSMVKRSDQQRVHMTTWCLLVKLFGATLPGMETAAGFQQLISNKLLAPLLRRAFLAWLVHRLWREPLGLMGMPSHSVVLDDSSSCGASTAEMEAALQLDAAAYARLHKRLAAFAASCTEAASSSSGRQRSWSWPSPQLAEAFHRFCADVGLSHEYGPAQELFLQAYQLRLLMGAAHPELRPCMSEPGAALDAASEQTASRHSVVKIIRGQGCSMGLMGGTGQLQAAQFILACRSPGWCYLFAGPGAQPARQEEVVVYEAGAQQQGASTGAQQPQRSGCLGNGRWYGFH